MYALAKWQRAFAAATLLLSLAALIARCTGAVYRLEFAHALDQAAAACDAEGKATAASLQFATLPWATNINNTNTLQQPSNTANSVARISEAAALVVMSVAVSMFFPVCIVMFRRVELRLAGVLQEMDHRPDAAPVVLPFEFSPLKPDGAESEEQIAMRCGDARKVLRTLRSAAAKQKRRFISAASIVLVMLFGRACYSLLRMYAFFPNIQNRNCKPCGACQSDGWLLRLWFNTTPELDPLITSLSSALPLVILLWLMMTKEDRRQLLSNIGSRRPSVVLLSGEEDMMKKERVRMGIELKATDFDW
jgi:hypothetical protein